MKKGFVLTILCFVFIYQLYAQSKPVEWLLLTDSSGQYSIKHPNNWNLNKGAKGDFNFALITRKEYEGDVYLDNITIAIKAVPNSDLLLEDLKLPIEKRLRKQFPIFALVKSIATIIGGQDALQMEYRTRSESSLGPIDLYMVMLTKIIQNKIVTLTLTCDFVDEAYKRFTPTALKIFETVTIQ